MKTFWNGSIRSIRQPETEARQSALFSAPITGMALLTIGFGLLAAPAVCRAQSSAPTNPQTVETPAPIQQANPGSGSTIGTPDAAQAAAAARIRVVRLSDVEGAVQILRGNTTQFSNAAMNMPLMQDSRIDTGADGRAEIEFEDGSVARITPNSSVSLTKLETAPDGTLNTTVEQRSGLVYYELRSDPKMPFQVMFQGRTITPAANSTFRINFTSTPPELAVLDGAVNIVGAADNYRAEVRQGQTITFQSPDSAQYTIANGIMPNGFDEWNDQRDQEAAQQAQNQTPARVQGGGSVMDGGIGWSDLDSYGGWYPLPGYGMVWQPYGVADGFDPYGYGMWANFGGAFGFTWVSGYPWGWLPFHYGMWSYINGFGWGWMPYGRPYSGFGWGRGGYGRPWHGWHHPYAYTNVYRGPHGYRSPVPPERWRGQGSGFRGHATPGHGSQNIVRVGDTGFRSGTNGHGEGFRARQGAAWQGNAGAFRDNRRAVRYNGNKVAPLHSMMSGVRVPTRNAALYNNYPRHAFRGDIRGSILERNAGVARGGSAPNGVNRNALGQGHHQFTRSANFQRGNVTARGTNSPNGVHAPLSASRRAEFNGARRGQFFQRQSGVRNEGSHRQAFGRQGSFGANNGSSGVHSGFRNRGFQRNEGGLRGGNQSVRFGGPPRGGFHGNAAQPTRGFNSGGVQRGGSPAATRGGGFHGGGGHSGGFSGGGFRGGGHAGGFSGASAARGGGHGR